MRQGGRRILLCDNTGGRAVMLQLIRFQWVGCLGLNWLALHVGLHTYIYNIYKNFQSQPTLFVTSFIDIRIVNTKRDVSYKDYIYIAKCLHTQFSLHKFNFCQIAQNKNFA
jgi:hypothetical protein